MKIKFMNPILFNILWHNIFYSIDFFWIIQNKIIVQFKVNFLLAVKKKKNI